MKELKFLNHTKRTTRKDISNNNNNSLFVTLA